MATDSKSLPRRIRVGEIVSARYAPGTKPQSWDERKPGIDIIRTVTGERITLLSGGAQSTPAPGWELLLTTRASELEGVSAEAVKWTLYGIPSANPHLSKHG